MTRWSQWCVSHPVATTLLTLAVAILGVLAFPRLPVAPLPQAEFPTIRVSASLPGASPNTMASAVATPLEVALSAVPGITEMTSSSSQGRVSITLQFSLDKDIDVAAQEVQAELAGVQRRLPEAMTSPPSWRKVNPADSPILVLKVQSEVLPMTELSDLAETVIARQITQIDGVSEVGITGQKRPAIRIRAEPSVLAAQGLTLADIREAVSRTTLNQPSGTLMGADRAATLQVNQQLLDPQPYADLVLRSASGLPVRLGDVAQVSWGAENDHVQAWQDGREGLNLIIRRQPDANIVATVDRILAALPDLANRLPASVEVNVLNDRTRTIRSSLHEVEITLALTVVLVVAVMGAFLRQWSATVIVATVLGVSLTATVGFMYLLGFSLNNLTLVALIIAVGFVVDDAIVVVENIHRQMERGLGMPQAAIAGAGEIGFTVVSISLSLVAAFIPLLFMDGVVGRLFFEFAVTVALAVLLSVLAALTLAPMMAAYMMKGVPSHEASGWVNRLVAAYGRSLAWSLRHPRTLMSVFVLGVAAAVWGYVVIPKGFFPLQDTAFVFGTTQGPQDASFDDMKARHAALAKVVAQDPAVQSYAHAVGATGGSTDMSSGRFWIVLKDRADRDVSAQQFIDRLRPQLAQVPGVTLFLRAAQDINLGTGPARTQYQYVLRAADSGVLGAWTQRLTDRLAALPALRDVSNDLQMGAGLVRIEIDRDAAARHGLTVDDVNQALYSAYGQRQIAEVQTEVNQYPVLLDIDAGLRGRIDSLEWLHLRSPTTGAMVPLLSVARVLPRSTGPVSIGRDGMQPAVTIAFNLAEGVSLGEAVELIERARQQEGLPADVSGEFRGAAQAFQDALQSQPWLILAALVAVYIILGVLYESFVHPLTILSTLPSAGVGALAMLWLVDEPFSVMALIGVVLLIGIVKKNGILLVDFALTAQRQQGVDASQAMQAAGVARVRPIMMTTLAALLAAIPLMIGLGTGAELRQPLGYAVVGGLLVSQLLTLYTTPVVYVMLDRFVRRPAHPPAVPPMT